MPVALMTGRRRVELEERPVPDPGPGEVLMEMSAVGLCGSDLHYWAHGQIGGQSVEYPQTLGHEPAGRIVALGQGVKGLRVGQDVAVEPGIPCGVCRECLMGRANLCPHVRFLGAPGMPGAFARYLAMPALAVEPLPKGVTPALGAASEPLGVAMHGFDLVGLRAGEHVAIVGGGGVGLCVAALARAQGARVVALCEPRAARREVARKLGVERVVGAELDAFVAAVQDGTGGVGADVVVECAGDRDTLNLSIEAAARGARVAMIGIPEVDMLPVNPHAWRRRELALYYVRRSNRQLSRCLRVLERSDLGLPKAGFFSGPVPLAGVQEALLWLEDDASDAVKVLIDPRMD